MTMNNPFEGKEIWFGVGSQDLYGEEALRQVHVLVAVVELVDVFLRNRDDLAQLARGPHGVQAWWRRSNNTPSRRRC